MNKAFTTVFDNVKQAMSSAVHPDRVIGRVMGQGFSDIARGPASESMGDAARRILYGGVKVGAGAGAFLSAADVAERGLGMRAGVAAVRIGASAGIMYGTIHGAKKLLGRDDRRR